VPEKPFFPTDRAPAVLDADFLKILNQHKHEMGKRNETGTGVGPKFIKTEDIQAGDRLFMPETNFETHTDWMPKQPLLPQVKQRKVKKLNRNKSQQCMLRSQISVRNSDQDLTSVYRSSSKPLLDSG